MVNIIVNILRPLIVMMREDSDQDRIERIDCPHSALQTYDEALAQHPEFQF